MRLRRHSLPLAFGVLLLAGGCTAIVGDRLEGAGADLAGVDLAGADLAAIDLAAIDLAGADLAGVDLAGPDLTPVDMVEGVGVPSASQSTIQISPGMVTADGSSNAIITVTVRDLNGSPLVNQPVLLSSTGTANTLFPSSGLSSFTGVFNATLASTKAEVKTVVATIHTFTIQADVSFTAGNAQQGSSTLSVAPATVTADGISTAAITVTVKDTNGNPVPDQAVTLAASGSANTLTPASGMTDANGVLAATLASTKAEAKTVTATVGAFMLNQPVTFVAGAADAAQSTVTANPSTGVVANGSAGSAITATIKDVYGNLVSGATVAFSATGGGTTLSPTSNATNGSGVATSTLRATTSGTKTVTAMVGATTITQQPTVDFVDCPTATALSSTPAAGSTVGGSDLYHPVCATPTDALERVYGFSLGAPSSVLIDRGASFAGAVTDLRPAASGCSADAQSLVCTSSRYLYCPNLAVGAYDVILDGASGATGPYAVSLTTAGVKGASSYGVIQTPATFTSITGVGGAVKLIADTTTENGTAGIVMPFAFKLFDTTHAANDSLTVFQSGYLGFAASPNTLQNACLATAALPAATIAPFWGRLGSRPASRGNIWWVTQGVAPNRSLTVEWNQMDAFTDTTATTYECISVSFQAILYEATGQIEFRYQAVDEDRCGSNTTADRNFAAGGHVTIGLQGATTGTIIEQVSCNTAAGTGPGVIGSCPAASGFPDPCTTSKGYLFIPRSAGCP